MSHGTAAAATVVVAALLGCGPSPSGAPPQPSTLLPTSSAVPVTIAPTVAPSADRTTGWADDLERLVPGMDSIHPSLTHGTTREALDRAVTSLAERIATSTNDELMVGVLRIVAMVSAAGCDAHTGAFIWGTGRYPVDSLPLRLWLFEDQVVIVDALPPYEALTGARIDAIDGRPIAEVLAALDPLIPRDNDQTVRLLTPRYLLIPQVLRGLGIADAGAVSLSLSTDPGVEREEAVVPIPMAEYNSWAGSYGLHLPEDSGVLYLSDIDTPLRWQILPDAVTLYVQYNRIDPLPAATVADLRAAAEGRDVERVVLDVRHNYGGELSALDPIVSLFSSPALDRPNGLYLITGRNTFSAGSILVARLDETSAVIVGEPMGGCPTLYGDSSELLLPFSGISVSVASELSVGVRADDNRATIEPDVIATLTRELWLDKRDPSLEAIVLAAP
jgi:hypothetical protein